MKILESIRQKLAFIGYLTDEGVFRYKFYHTIVSLGLILSVIAFQLTAAIYMWRHLQMGDIENSLYAGLDVPATSMVIGTLLTIMYSKEKVRKVIDDFQNIFDKCKDRYHSTTHRVRVNLFYLQARTNIRLSSLCGLTNFVRNF